MRQRRALGELGPDFSERSRFSIASCVYQGQVRQNILLPGRTNGLLRCAASLNVGDPEATDVDHALDSYFKWKTLSTGAEALVESSHFRTKPCCCANAKSRSLSGWTFATSRKIMSAALMCENLSLRNLGMRVWLTAAVTRFPIPRQSGKCGTKGEIAIIAVGCGRCVSGRILQRRGSFYVVLPTAEHFRLESWTRFTFSRRAWQPAGALSLPNVSAILFSPNRSVCFIKLAAAKPLLWNVAARGRAVRADVALIVEIESLIPG